MIMKSIKGWFKDLNPEELLYGATEALVWVLFSMWWSFVTIPLASFFWAFGGKKGTRKVWRRALVPFIICLGCALSKWTWIPLIAILPVFGINSIGYGIPSWNGPCGVMDDKGSIIGRFWWRRVRGGMVKGYVGEEQAAHHLTRATIALLRGLAMCPLAFVSVGFWSVGIMALVIAEGTYGE